MIIVPCIQLQCCNYFYTVTAISSFSCFLKENTAIILQMQHPLSRFILTLTTTSPTAGKHYLSPETLVGRDCSVTGAAMQQVLWPYAPQEMELTYPKLFCIQHSRVSWPRIIFSTKRILMWVNFSPAGLNLNAFLNLTNPNSNPNSNPNYPIHFDVAEFGFSLKFLRQSVLGFLQSKLIAGGNETFFQCRVCPCW